MQEIKRWDYNGEGIDEQAMPAAPWDAVTHWVDAARTHAQGDADRPDPDAIEVATVDPTGHPQVRTVLMRYLTPEGPGFYTNLSSHKGRDLRHDPRVAATLTWPTLFRAVRFVGTAHELSRETVADYFQARPWGSRISAWASHQSQPVAGRAQLEAAVAAYERRWPDTGAPDDVPVPDFWGGYLIRCDEVELWAGRRSRLHDRLVYVRTGNGDLSDAADWRIERRQP
ncbi:pyridoxamine 5'-phosphate oxidase [Leekyejoonella antrihumi]|uniref:Pyridoxamine 5'-phosphate oxidase n=1 Tax=Leekyejoonella antrihumi TaxID=1660198 RepID=A0A563DZ27_9MICO|nr:pyridoxamine 5'-phosphate oxidase [Leekyejoonella antrihumi]TWP35455.1 pyridoxamine 5'-phosphate oxidase [Leekyejoonella antrihumi]